MLDALGPIAASADLTIPERHRRPIGVIGAGVIVDVAHLPAYTAAGLEVVAITDINLDKARDVAARHGIEHVTSSADELLARDDIAVVDIAVVPWAQAEIAHGAIDRGMHLMCQKPLSLEIDEALAIVEHAETAGVRLAVNQQLRFDEGIAAAHAMIESGWIGELISVRIDVDITTDWSAWPWLVEAPRLEIQYHSIHYLDAIRYLVGDPTRVYATAQHVPGQVPVAETRTTSVLSFDRSVNAVVTVNHENRTGDTRAEFRIDGTEGVIKGTLGLLYDYPNGRPDTLMVKSAVLPTDGWLPYPVTTRWIPDAFAGPMGSLLRWIDGGDPALTSGRDNLGTLALVHALYESIDTGESVPVPTVGTSV